MAKSVFVWEGGCFLPGDKKLIKNWFVCTSVPFFLRVRQKAGDSGGGEGEELKPVWHVGENSPSAVPLLPFVLFLFLESESEGHVSENSRSVVLLLHFLLFCLFFF